MNAARAAVKAMEDAGVRWAFGIPGTHNLALYEALEGSGVEAVLVTDEQSAGFMADAVSRAGGGLGAANLVPGAGVTHALSGIAEAFLDGSPMLVLACGVRRGLGKAYQLHDIDQKALLAPVVKAVLSPAAPAETYGVVRRACDLARAGCPGPVAVELPADFLTREASAGPGEDYGFRGAAEPEPGALAAAAALLDGAARPVIYAGRGAAGAAGELRELAEALGAPVCTTISGKGVFPESHALWLWNGLEGTAPDFVRGVLRRADAMLAIGCRFGEVATGSYGFSPPAGLIHVDIDPEVFQRNAPARVACRCDAREFLRLLLARTARRPRRHGLEEEIRAGHEAVRRERAAAPRGRGVRPGAFFCALQAAAPEAIFTVDSGNGAFLAMEHLRLDSPGRFLAPTDFSCMGFSVPAAVAAKLAKPASDVVAVTGDGALLMTGLELLTAAQRGRAPVVCVMRDGELSQIAQFQELAGGKRSCTRLPEFRVEAFAAAAGARHFLLEEEERAGEVLAAAVSSARSGAPAVVEVKVDYSARSYFTRGVVRSAFGRLGLGERLALAARAAGRLLAAKLSG